MSNRKKSSSAKFESSRRKFSSSQAISPSCKDRETLLSSLCRGLKRGVEVPLEHVVAKRRDGRRPSSLGRERENDDEWKIREAQPLIQLDRNPGFNQHTETHREMFCSKPSGFVRHNWLPPRDPIEKSNTRDFFFLFHGRWLRCELYRYHPSSSIENACSDWSASDPPRRAPYIDPRISPRRIQNGLCDRSNFDFIFRQLSPRNLADVILVEDSYVDWSFRKGGGIFVRFFSRDMIEYEK